MAGQARVGPQAFVSLAVTALGAIGLWQSLLIPASPIGDSIGSAAFPVVVSIGIVVCGLSLGLQAVRGGWACIATDPDEPPLSMRSVALLAAAFGAMAAVLLMSGSFILAATTLFGVSVQAFRPGRFVGAFAIGFTAATLTYLVFSVVLGLDIGEGWIERILRWMLSLD